MIVRQKSRLLKNSVALVTTLGVAGILAGCTTARSPFVAQGPLVTNSVNTAQNADLNQAMPSAIGALPNSNPTSPAPVRVAQNTNAPFTPPADVGGSYGSTYPTNSGSQDPLLAGNYPQTQASNSNFGNVAAAPSQVSQQPLPSLSPLPVKSTTTMTASTSPAEIQTQPQTLQPPATQTAATPRLVPENAFMHKIEAGESLYVIARRYDVTPQAIVTANGLASADRIFVGQELIIPGRPDLIAQKAPAPQKVAEAAPQTQVSQVQSDAPQSSPTPIARPQGLKVAAAPTQTQVQQPKPQAAAPKQVETKPAPQPQQEEIKTASVPQAQITATPQAQPQSQGFRWPVSGRMIQDFKASKNTGINIEAPEGTSVKAADAGTVIYTGNAVEGYGNLVLIKHPNGYVSAYAHLKDISVSKGTNVGRGDQIGSVGLTGSVARPQLHFELRKGATPVDPAPLLVS
ncbi:murein DD-endopeptidase MepM/ murein hydrolase activator NlpD [Maritalea mobilis]|uniref:Murein DD-endopeptidase MepM/ murein hydrolase activator NlpD n=2 Tax=Maritalea mobilis TaxID=483324 RepID=A0A4R6VQE3_9HYPH|nr:murein DD-endopeptidase MepM/ murein hydrolase activator NlpD [Maritalea mobilis]